MFEHVRILEKALGRTVAHEADLGAADLEDEAERSALDVEDRIEAVVVSDGTQPLGHAPVREFGEERLKGGDDGGAPRVAHDEGLVEPELLGFEKLERRVGVALKYRAVGALALAFAPAQLGLRVLQGAQRDERGQKRLGLGRRGIERVEGLFGIGDNLPFIVPVGVDAPCCCFRLLL
mgnify:CR=1 FL=1